MNATWITEWLASLNTVWVEAKPERKPIEGWLLQYADGELGTTLFSADEVAEHKGYYHTTVHLVEATEAKEIWRLLERGEIIEAGDEWFGGIMGWANSLLTNKNKVTIGNIYRRRVKVVEVQE